MLRKSRGSPGDVASRIGPKIPDRFSATLTMLVTLIIGAVDAMDLVLEPFKRQHIARGVTQETGLERRYFNYISDKHRSQFLNCP